MTQLITTIPVTVGNSVIAENMIDWIYQLNGRVTKGHALLCYDADTHEERRQRVKLAAELAYESFDEIVMPSRNTKDKMASANAVRNNLFLGIAEHCQKNFRVPWLWLEPGSCPTGKGWFEFMCNAYSNQPRRYMGTHLKASAESDSKFLHPVSIYHMGCFNDVAKLVNENMDAPFEMVAGPVISVKSTKWRLVQPLKILDESDMEKVWPEAAVVFGDESGALIEKYRADGVHHAVQIPVATSETFTFDPSINMNHDELRYRDGGNGNRNWSSEPTPPKIDKRTKEYRALKAAQQAKEQQ